VCPRSESCGWKCCIANEREKRLAACYDQRRPPCRDQGKCRLWVHERRFGPAPTVPGLSLTADIAASVGDGREGRKLTHHLFAVGTRVTSRPPHRSVRAAFPHTAPTSGIDGKTCRMRANTL
jgi:hypothetical protein